MNSRIFRAVVDLFAPPACCVCAAWLHETELSVCATCAAELESPEIDVDAGCAEQIVAATRYSALMRDAIRAFKFSHQPWRSAGLAELTIRRTQLVELTFDVVVPVPLSRGRLRERGYNQAGLLASHIGTTCGKKVVHGAVVRCGDDTRQSSRSAAERAEIAGSWSVSRPSLLLGRRVLLVDDVVTTGATVRSIAACLLSAGAASVVAAAVAATPRHGWSEEQDGQETTR